MGEYEMRDERITDTIPKVHLDVNDEQVVMTSLRGTWSVNPNMIWKPEARVGLENNLVGQVARYAFWHDEVLFILGGKAELIYSMPCTRFSVEKRMTVEKGDALVIPCGADVEFKVEPGGPLEKFFVSMPAPPRYRSDLMPPEARWPGL